MPRRATVRKKKDTTTRDVFWRDALVRACYAQDFLYYHTDVTKKKPGRKLASVIGALEEETGLFAKMHEYFQTHVTLHHAGVETPPDEVDFHPQWGWVVSSKLGEAQLGKLAISGSPRIVAGIGTYISAQCTVYGSGTLRFGCWCCIAAGTTFYTRLGDHQMDFPSLFSFARNPRFQSLVPLLPLKNYIGSQDVREKSDVTLGHNVWVARNANIMPGVTLHDGAAVGTGSLVTKSCESFGLYVGVPARRLRDRFRPAMQKELRAAAWWDWPLDKLRRNQRFLDTDLTKYRGRLRDLIVE